MTRPKVKTVPETKVDDSAARAERACASTLAPDERVFIKHVTMFEIASAVLVARTLAECGLTMEVEGPKEQSRTDFLTLYAVNRTTATER